MAAGSKLYCTVMEIIQRIIPVAVNSKDKKRSLAEVLKNIRPFEVEVPEEGDKKTLNPPPLVGRRYWRYKRV